jgi:hypothetical protein
VLYGIGTGIGYVNLQFLRLGFPDFFFPNQNQNAVLLLFFGYTFSVGAQNVTVIVALIQLYCSWLLHGYIHLSHLLIFVASITYSHELRMCVLTASTPTLIAVWSFPVRFSPCHQSRA